MKKIQKSECEHGVWPNERCRKPRLVKELLAKSSGVGGVAGTELNDHLVDAGEIEDGELAFLRGVGARVSSGVAELPREAEGTEKHGFEELPVPFLRTQLAECPIAWTHTDLNAMEGELRMAIEETILTANVAT